MEAAASRVARAEPPPFEHGFEKGRRREDAMITFNACGARFKKLGFSTVAGLYDLRSAFHCPEHEERIDWTRGTYTEADHRIVIENSLADFTVRVSAKGGTSDFRIFQGLLMGNKRAPQDFISVLAPRVAHWQGLNGDTCERGPLAKAGYATCRFLRREIDISFTQFADDLPKRTAGREAE